MAFIDIYKGTIGLNTKLDPKSLSQGVNDNNIIELAEAVNISIDERGLCSLRYGNIEEQTGEFHSLFCKGGDCFVVQERESDAAIMKVATDYTLSEVTIVNQDLRMCFDQIGEDTFYSNGIDKGYIYQGTAYSWPVHEYNGPKVDLQFGTSIPSVKHLAFMSGGKILIAVGNAIFQNHSPYQYGLFSPGKGNIASFATDVTMIAVVRDGFFASDGLKTSFFKSTNEWYLYQQTIVEDAAVLEWSLAHDKVKLNDIGFDSSDDGRIWTSTKGICLGTDSGQFFNLTKEKIKYPSGYTSGACLIKDNVVIHTI